MLKLTISAAGLKGVQTMANDGNQQDPEKKKRDPVPLWIMGALVLTVIFIVWYGPN
jgi:hypothetical protein